MNNLLIPLENDNMSPDYGYRTLHFTFQTNKFMLLLQSKKQDYYASPSSLANVTDATRLVVAYFNSLFRGYVCSRVRETDGFEGTLEGDDGSRAFVNYVENQYQGKNDVYYLFRLACKCDSYTNNSSEFIHVSLELIYRDYNEYMKKFIEIINENVSQMIVF